MSASALSPEQPISPEMDRWTMKDQEDQQDQPKPARPSTAQISPEMDRWTMEDQGRPGRPTQAAVLAQLDTAQREQLQPSSNSTPAQIGPHVDRWTKVDQRGPGCIQPNIGINRPTCGPMDPSGPETKNNGRVQHEL